MKILALSLNPLDGVGGGERSLARLSWELAKNCQVTVLAPANSLPFYFNDKRSLRVLAFDYSDIKKGKVSDRLIRIINAHDVLYVSGKHSLLLLFKLNLQASITKVPIVFKESSKGKLFKLLSQLPTNERHKILKMISGVVCISSDIYREFKQKTDNILTAYIPNGINLDLFHPLSLEKKYQLRKRYKMETELPIFLYSGRFADKKNLDIIFGAWWEMEQKYNVWAKLILIGKAHKRYDQMFIKLIVNNLKNVTILDPIKLDEDIAPWYQLSDFYIAPTSREGLSNSFLEAGACGLYPVVSSSSGYKDVVRNENIGRLVEERDTSGVIKCLHDFKDNFEEQRDRGRNYTAKLIAQMFSIKDVANDIKLFFEQVTS